jgi:hypothetical protein
MMLDGIGILVGGMIVGAAGIAWMVASGAWPHFVTMVTDWNAEYFAYDVTAAEQWRIIAGSISRSLPWVLIHFAAIPLALRNLWRSRDASSTLLGALYLGWSIQALLLQHLYDYVYMPAHLLAFAVVFGEAVRSTSPTARTVFICFLAVCMVCRGKILIDDRANEWLRCCAFGSEPNVRNRLSRLHQVNWRELNGVAYFLKTRRLADGELTCFNIPTSALYRELDVEAATRYHFFQHDWLAFRKHRPDIRTTLKSSGQRYVVVDLYGEGLRLKEPDLDQLPASWVNWKQHIVLQSGRYIVLEISGSDTPTWLDDCFP